MLKTSIVLLVVLWLLGLVTSTSLGGLIHLLLVIAVIIIVFRLISGRRA
ncbi:lmo0937 family membrane protein [Cyanobium sp. ATX 6A2]|nr:lmo0937 family membrane protein [Cyanobium sp. ATX 6A2]MCP9888059.1 lmo0937 family membrane protein [Cyanobium sp. ATX 6A2]